jgi:hypothetical protein
MFCFPCWLNEVVMLVDLMHHAPAKPDHTASITTMTSNPMGDPQMAMNAIGTSIMLMLEDARGKANSNDSHCRAPFP